MKKYFISLLLALVFILGMGTSAFALTNPTSISFGADNYTKVFKNVMETGDMLVVAEGYVNYATLPTDYVASESYRIGLWDTTNAVPLVEEPLQSFGDRPITIYLTADDVSAIGLTSGTAYIVKIRPVPTIMASSASNTVYQALSASDYVDQELGQKSSPPNNNLLRNGMLSIAYNMQVTDNTTYTERLDGYTYLNSAGGGLFLTGQPLLMTMCPILFSVASDYMISPAPEHTAAYTQTLTVTQKWGQTTANALTNIGAYLGISQALAGSVVLFAIGLAFSVFIYKYTQSGISVLLMISAVPFIGAYLGLMPLALAFAMVILVVIGMGYFFFSRGAL